MKKLQEILILVLCCLALGACSSPGQADGTREGNGSWPDGRPAGESLTGHSQGAEDDENPKTADFTAMQWEEGLALDYADQFFVEKSDAFYLITIVDSGRFLLIPEGVAAPDNVPADIVVLQKPLDHVYLASSSVFDLVREDGALDHILFSGTKKEDLCITEAAAAIEQGKMLYAGKYSKPDYELLVANGCDLAIENTMIYHNPEAKEKLESLGIPVLVEASSYESHPFGRMEWMKLYGLLFDHLEEAQDFFEKQIGQLEPVLQQEKTDAKIAVFYVNSNGVINVRKPGDYVAKMVSLAGGNYVPESTSQEEENALSTMNMQMEDFYLAARDADILVYNSTIMGELAGVNDLVAINPVFADFKAVKEGRIYCTGKNFYQETTAIGNFVLDLGKAIRDKDETSFYQLKKLK